MTEEKRLVWHEHNIPYIVFCKNTKNEMLGSLRLERVGRHMHWCWYQEDYIRMSPGCLQEVRDKQKELLKESGGLGQWQRIK